MGTGHRVSALRAGNRPIFSQLHSFGVAGEVTTDNVDRLLDERENTNEGLARKLEGTSRIAGGAARRPEGPVRQKRSMTVMPTAP